MSIASARVPCKYNNNICARGGSRTYVHVGGTAIGTRQCSSGIGTRRLRALVGDNNNKTRARTDGPYDFILSSPSSSSRCCGAINVRPRIPTKLYCTRRILTTVLLSIYRVCVYIYMCVSELQRIAIELSRIFEIRY